MVRTLLERWGVVALRSPVRRPSYNGAAERGLGWWKILAAGSAASAGREGVWRAADLERGRRMANELPRERRAPACEPWEGRKAISCQERQRFLAAYGLRCQRERARLELPAEEVFQGERLGATIGRRAALAALCELNYLTIRRR